MSVNRARTTRRRSSQRREEERKPEPQTIDAKGWMAIIISIGLSVGIWSYVAECSYDTAAFLSAALLVLILSVSKK